MSEARKFVVEKGIPVAMWARQGKYPWHEMEVGDSFMVPGLTENKTPTGAYKVTAAVAYFNSKHKQKFTARTVEGGMRVWRIA